MSYSDDDVQGLSSDVEMMSEGDVEEDLEEESEDAEDEDETESEGEVEDFN